MSSTPNDENDIVTITELVDYETRNLTGCDNDDSCCTFPKGYVYRQALYLCVTCLEITGKHAGICYPCAVHCHSEHRLIDLFTKRNFRCDCGNASFPSNIKCKLWEDKDDINQANTYNHNYSGLFCICASEYKEIEESEDMFQCNICEDWYHLTHLSDNLEELSLHRSDIIDNSKEFTCKNCITKHDYLHIYNRAFLNNVSKEGNSEDKENSAKLCRLVSIKEAMARTPMLVEELSCGVFWPEDGRQRLCDCVSCKQMMERDGLVFLLDEKDPMSYYYGQAEESDGDLNEALSDMPYSQAIVIAEGIASYKRDLSKFMSSLDPAKVVTSEDVKEFFDSLKKRRLDGQD